MFKHFDNFDLLTIVLWKLFEAFNTLYEDLRSYNSKREMKIFEECLQKSLMYFSFLILIWKENELYLTELLLN